MQETICFYSDNCGGQNRNRYLVLLCHQQCSSIHKTNPTWVTGGWAHTEWNWLLFTAPLRMQASTLMSTHHNSGMQLYVLEDRRTHIPTEGNAESRFLGFQSIWQEFQKLWPRWHWREAGTKSNRRKWRKMTRKRCTSPMIMVQNSKGLTWSKHEAGGEKGRIFYLVNSGKVLSISHRQKIQLSPTALQIWVNTGCEQLTLMFVIPRCFFSHPIIVQHFEPSAWKSLAYCFDLSSVKVLSAAVFQACSKCNFTSQGSVDARLKLPTVPVPPGHQLRANHCRVFHTDTYLSE